MSPVGFQFFIALCPCAGWPKSVFMEAVQLNRPVSSKSSYLQASKWVLRVLEAFAISDETALTSALRAAENLNLDGEDIAVVVLSSQPIWAFHPEAFRFRRQ